MESIAIADGATTQSDRLLAADSDKLHTAVDIGRRYLTPLLATGSEAKLRLRAAGVLTVWYLFSFATLFLNKYVLAYEQGDAALLAVLEMLTVCVMSYLHLRIGAKTSRSSTIFSRAIFDRKSLVLGALRFLTLVLGLIALNFVAVSFAETVKSSAPMFTVVISFLLLRERTTMAVIASLLPIMLGLGLCSANELSFNVIGFAAALGTNIVECTQFVVSKMMVSPGEFDESGFGRLII